MLSVIAGYIDSQSAETYFVAGFIAGLLLA